MQACGLWSLASYQRALLWPAVSSPRRSTARAGHPSPSESLECGSLEAFLASDASAFVEHTKRCDTLAACWLAGSAGKMCFALFTDISLVFPKSIE